MRAGGVLVGATWEAPWRCLGDAWEAHDRLLGPRQVQSYLDFEWWEKLGEKSIGKI